MAADTLDELLKLPTSERAELALALRESLTDSERDAEAVLTDEQKAELDRHLAAYLADPESAVPWELVDKRLRLRS